MYKSGLLAGGSAVGQNGNVAIYLTAESDKPYLWLVPTDAEVVQKGGVTFVRCEKTTSGNGSCRSPLRGPSWSVRPRE